VKQDISLAKELFAQAADKGEGMGATFLGVLALKGIGGEPNQAAALDWFQRGVKLHDPIAYFQLGIFYHIYDAQHHPIGETVDLLRHSSEKGYIPAKFSLATILLKQPEFAHSDQEPVALLQEASDSGDWKATEELGDLTLNGDHAQRDPARAFYYFQLSSLQADPAAQESLQLRIGPLTQTLPQEEQTRQTAQANDWYATHRLSRLFTKSNEIIPALRASSSRPSLPTTASQADH
jgi:TPR repeat protein